MFLRSSQPYGARRRDGRKDKEKRTVYTYRFFYGQRPYSIIVGIKRKAIIGQDVADVMS